MYHIVAGLDPTLHNHYFFVLTLFFIDIRMVIL